MEEKIKIALIHGSLPVDGIAKNGEIVEISTFGDDERFHILLFLEYLENNYKDNEMLQGYDSRIAANKVALTLAELGNIVFLNTTTYRKDMLIKHGKTGVIIIPSDWTIEQKESLLEFKEKIKDFSHLQIWYDVSDQFDATMIMGDADVIDNFFIKSKTK